MTSNLLEILDRASSSKLLNYNPGPIIQAVNALIPLGKKGALDSIAAFFEEADRQADPRQGLFWVLRVLFEVPADPGYHPPVRLGAPRPPAPGDMRLLPRFPIVLIEDIPLLVVTSYILGGLPEAVDSHLAHFEAKGLIRSRLLRPTIDFENEDDLERIVVAYGERYRTAYGTTPNKGQFELILAQLKRLDQ